MPETIEKPGSSNAPGFVVYAPVTTPARRSYDKQRGTRTQRGYDNRWLRARRRYLAANPLCRLCQQVGRTTAATVVDHVVPHRGDRALFWDESNWQPLCKECHDSVKAQEERGGVMRGCDADGLPLGASHHWHR